MKDARLVSMVDFLLSENDKLKLNSNESLEVKSFWNCIKYARFLSKSLTISMFTPAIEKDGEWVILKEPKQYIGALEFGMGKDYEKAIEYSEALKKVFFKNSMGVNIITYMNVCKTIEDLSKIKKQFIPRLTEYGIKAIGI